VWLDIAMDQLVVVEGLQTFSQIYTGPANIPNIIVQGTDIT